MSQVVDGIGKMVDLGANWCSLSAGGATRAEWLKGIEKLSKEVVEKVNA